MIGIKNTKRKINIPTMLLTAIVFIASCVLSFSLKIPIKTIVKNYNYSVIIILVVMELLINLIVDTGIMQLLANSVARISNGSKKLCLCLFGAWMFFLSAFLNNITAVLVVMPVVLALLKMIDSDSRFIKVFFAVMLAMSNTGGAASPIGDFPAIVIMTSGITSFLDYLFRAFPLFIVTSVILLLFWLLFVKESSKKTTPQVQSLRQSAEKVDYGILIPLMIVMVSMFIAWSVIPQDVLPPEIVAVIGYCISVIIVTLKGKKISPVIDLKSVLAIASFLFMATVISASGILEKLVAFLESNIADPKILLIVIMLITSVVSGLFSAGPAAAAMLPAIVKLCETTFVDHTHWVAIAYAASICAGSSLFLWSATAGFILSSKYNSTTDESKSKWSVKEYLGYGVVNYLIQMCVAIVWIVIVL